MVRLRRLGKLAPRYHSGWPGARSLRPEWYHGQAIVERLVVTWCCFQRPQALLSILPSAHIYVVWFLLAGPQL